MFQDARVVITGGSSGAGKQLARQLIARGAWVTLLARDPDRLRGARDELCGVAPAERIAVAVCNVAEEFGLTGATAGMRTDSRIISSCRPRGHGPALALAVALGCACEINPPANYAAPYPHEKDPYAGERTSGGEAQERPQADVDDEQIGQMFPQLRGARRARTCAPAAAAWVILTYEPEVLDKHRVRTRELHCNARVVDDRCTVVSEVRYYLDDPREYFAVDASLSLERALRIAKLTRSWAGDIRLGALAAEKGGVYLVTLSECGAEKLLATRIKGAGAQQKLEVIETRSSIEL